MGTIRLEDEEGNVYTTKVCPTSTEVTLVYEVDIEGGEWFSESHYHFYVGQQGEDGMVETAESATFTNATTFSTIVTYATECTKYATLTLDGTILVYTYDNDEATEVIYALNALDYILASHSFVLDMADPEAMAYSINFPGLPTEPASSTEYVLGFRSYDTKCLQPYDEKIHFNVCVDKGIGNWEESFDYFDEEVILGEGSPWNNEITIEGTYVATKTSEDDYDTADAELGFNIPALDLATITATMSVHDCCCETCILDAPCVDCGIGGNVTHMTEVAMKFVVDNVFFSSMLATDDIFETEGFPGEEGGIPVLPVSPAYASYTIRLADANWDVNNPFLVWWSVSTVDGSYFWDPSFNKSSATGTVMGECSGYATKSERILTGNINADLNTVQLFGATEVQLTFTATAVDNARNVFPFRFHAIFDTIPPTLTHFTAFRDQINNESWIEFAFSQKPETAELALTVTASGTFLYDLEDAEEITGQENAYRLNTGVTLPYDTVLTLGATSTDLAGNIGFATKQATVSLSSPR
jgi:hypothetical protein